MVGHRRCARAPPAGFLESYKTALSNLGRSVGAQTAPDNIRVVELSAGSINVTSSTSFYTLAAAAAFVGELRCCLPRHVAPYAALAALGTPQTLVRSRTARPPPKRACFFLVL